MKKKVLSLLLTLCLVMTFVPMAAFAEDAQNISVWDGSTAAAFAGGTGTAEDPYQIANGAELAYLASSVNNGETYEAKNFVLTANIDLNGLPWTPIANSFSDALFGGSDYRVFAGNFDGKGYTISNVSIGSETTPLESDVFGLFGATEGKISNLNLDTVSIHGVAKIASGYVIGIAGGLVGSSAGSIENCHGTGLAMDMSAPSDVYAAAYWVGGLVGALDGAQLINECSVSGSITEKAGKGSIGGLIGELGKTAKITYSRSDVAVNVMADPRGGADVGGFIGKGNGKTDAETVIRNCYATGNVTGGAYTGGFAGGLWGLNIKNCYASGNVSQAAAAMASFVGTDASDQDYYGSITNCFATGSVTGSSPFQYAFAEQSSATKRSEITNCYFAEENSGIKKQYESATEKPQDEMKNEAFAALLNKGDDSNGWSFVNGQVLCGAEPADYSAVEAAMAAIPTDLTVYTDESVAALNTAVDGVVRGKAFVSQANVNAMAQAIQAAIIALQYKDADYTKVDAAIAKAKALKKDDYKDFSAVETAVNAVVHDKNITEQSEVDAMAKAIEDAIAALQYKDADYTKVDAAIAKANALNKDNYKDFSAVEAAVHAVVRDKNITEQSKVDAMAKAIEDAIAALQYKDADYAKVDAAIAKANALNKDNYKDFSAVEAAVNAVARGKNITQQAEVDAMAKAIEDAIAALQYKDADKTTPAPAATATPAPAATATPAPAATATPQYTIPQTGDTSNPALLVVLMLVSGSAAIGTAVVGSKKKHNR
ncbi:GLUG motif-containing protein [Gemmiger formicilis]|uniref:GLUG motif-containing protein n=1 Tax=Gemmiger formicilis TaxID=745368 RepID=UPI00164E25BF|nr:GLUG motif-containing protein [Gemmiger formicilis]